MSQTVQGENIDGLLVDPNTKPIGWQGGPVIYQNAGTIKFRNSTNSADAPITVASVTFPDATVQSTAATTPSLGTASYIMPVPWSSITARNIGTANTVTVYKFTMAVSFTCANVSFTVSTGIALSLTYVALYDSSKNIIVQTTGISTIVGTTEVSAALSTILTPASYYIAVACDKSSLQIHGQNLVNPQGAIQNSGSDVVLGTAANALSGSTMPSALGALTGITAGMPYFKLY